MLLLVAGVKLEKAASAFFARVKLVKVKLFEMITKSRMCVIAQRSITTNDNKLKTTVSIERNPFPAETLRSYKA